jgi:GTP-binding protein
MVIHSAEFVKSSPSLSGCPEGLYPEYAFIGRSNVGKSSLINMVTNFSGLAKTSSRPGKTQLINHFIINGSWYLTDLPGFGFAKVPVIIKNKWEKMIKDYLLKRKNLVCSFLLIDIRHEPLKNDIEFMEWCAIKQVPFYIVFTKADKLTYGQQKAALQKYLSVLSKNWDPLPSYIVSSSNTREGRDQILEVIQINNERVKD